MGDRRVADEKEHDLCDQLEASVYSVLLVQTQLSYSQGNYIR